MSFRRDLTGVYPIYCIRRHYLICFEPIIIIASVLLFLSCLWAAYFAYNVIYCVDPLAPPGGVTAQSVFRLMSDANVCVLLMDVRSRDDFITSHIKSIDCINVPADCLKPGWVKPMTCSVYFVFYLWAIRIFTLWMLVILYNYKNVKSANFGIYVAFLSEFVRLLFIYLSKHFYMRMYSVQWT